MTRTLVRSSVAVAAFLLIGCHGAPRPADTLTTSTRPSEWAAADSLLSGFEFGEVGSAWRAGDRVLLGVRSQRGERITLRYLLVELMDGVDAQTPLAITFTEESGRKTVSPLAPPSRFTRITVFDEGGKQLVQSRGTVPEKLLNNGLFGMRNAEATTRPDSSSDRAFLALVSIVSFSASSGGNSALSSMTRDVVGLPSLLAMLTRRPTLNINTTGVHPGAATLADTPWPAAEVSLEISINDELMLNVETTAVENRPPIGLVSGIVTVDGRHPTDTTRHLRMKLLAARRGTGAAFEAYKAR
jgi:hypothetical protein